MNSRPLVTIVMPVLNEGGHLPRALAAIDAQTYPRELIEILIVDGGSTDDTLEVAQARADADRRTRVLGGPGVNTPLAMQLGIAAASGQHVAKVDGHGWINRDFIATAVDELARDGVGCVGGLIDPVAETPVERAIAAARFSRLGVGGGVYTLAATAQETDTVQCGVYRRDALTEAGGFDPALPFGEDEEANHRVRRGGWTIRLAPQMRFHYHVRPSVLALFRQYFRYGRARVAVVRKHPGFLRPKHLVPAALVIALAAAPLVAILVASAWPLGMWLLYLLAVAMSAAWLSSRTSSAPLHLVAASLMALHVGYGMGLLRGLLDRPPRYAPA